jgi:hypothetical protein
MKKFFSKKRLYMVFLAVSICFILNSCCALFKSNCPCTNCCKNATMTNIVNGTYTAKVAYEYFFPMYLAGLSPENRNKMCKSNEEIKKAWNLVVQSLQMIAENTSPSSQAVINVASFKTLILGIEQDANASDNFKSAMTAIVSWCPVIIADLSNGQVSVVDGAQCDFSYLQINFLCNNATFDGAVPSTVLSPSRTVSSVNKTQNINTLKEAMKNLDKKYYTKEANDLKTVIDRQ